MTPRYLYINYIFKCENPFVIINDAATLQDPQINFKNDLIKIVGATTIKCNEFSNQKEWTIFKGIYPNEQQIFINNNPTMNYADLVLQPQTLSYGVYRKWLIWFSVVMLLHTFE
jgi:hypothetical protein